MSLFASSINSDKFVIRSLILLFVPTYFLSYLSLIPQEAVLYRNHVGRRSLSFDAFAGCAAARISSAQRQLFWQIANFRDVANCCRVGPGLIQIHDYTLIISQIHSIARSPRGRCSRGVALRMFSLYLAITTCAYDSSRASIHAPKSSDLCDKLSSHV